MENYLELKKVSDNGFIVLKENNDGEAFFFSVGLGAVLSPGERIDFGMVLEGRNLYNASWLVKEGEEDYSKPTMLATFVNPNYGPKKIEKKTEQDVAKQGDTVQNQFKTVVRRQSQNKNYLKTFQYLDWLWELDSFLF